jgi:osmotically-inducible protein OsmY
MNRFDDPEYGRRQDDYGTRSYGRPSRQRRWGQEQRGGTQDYGWESSQNESDDWREPSRFGDRSSSRNEFYASGDYRESRRSGDWDQDNGSGEDWRYGQGRRGRSSSRFQDRERFQDRDNYRGYDMEQDDYGRGSSGFGDSRGRGRGQSDWSRQGEMGRGYDTRRGRGSNYSESGRGWGSQERQGASGQPASFTYTEFWIIPGPFEGQGPQGYRRSEDRIKEDVCERMQQHGYLDASNIQIDVEDGEVTLSGTVQNRWSKRTADDIAASVNGVRDVHNRLSLQQEDREEDREETRDQGREDRGQESRSRSKKGSGLGNGSNEPDDKRKAAGTV